MFAIYDSFCGGVGLIAARNRHPSLGKAEDAQKKKEDVVYMRQFWVVCRARDIQWGNFAHANLNWGRRLK